MNTLRYLMAYIVFMAGACLAAPISAGVEQTETQPDELIPESIGRAHAGGEY